MNDKALKLILDENRYVNVHNIIARKLNGDIATNAIYFHCFPHCNELIVQDSTKQSTLLSMLLNLCQLLYGIVGADPKRILLFKEVQADFQNESDMDDYKVL